LARWALAALAALATSACASLRGGDEEAPPPALAAPGTPDPLESLPMRGTPVPDAPDFAARDLAAAALVGDRQAADTAQRRLEELERARATAGEPGAGLAARTWSTPPSPTRSPAAGPAPRCCAATISIPPCAASSRSRSRTTRSSWPTPGSARRAGRGWRAA
jgi:hypothetical protein